MLRPVPTPLPSPIVVESGGWSDPSAVIGGLVGVAGGLLIYGLQHWSAQKKPREDFSIRAAGDLLATLATFAHAYRDPTGMPGFGGRVMTGSGSSSGSAWPPWRPG